MRTRISRRAEIVVRVNAKSMDFLQVREKNVAPKRKTFSDFFKPINREVG